MRLIKRRRGLVILGWLRLLAGQLIDCRFLSPQLVKCRLQGLSSLLSGLGSLFLGCHLLANRIIFFGRICFQCGGVVLGLLQSGFKVWNLLLQSRKLLLCLSQCGLSPDSLWR